MGIDSIYIVCNIYIYVLSGCQKCSERCFFPFLTFPTFFLFFFRFPPLGQPDWTIFFPRFPPGGLQGHLDLGPFCGPLNSSICQVLFSLMKTLPKPIDLDTFVLCTSPDRCGWPSTARALVNCFFSVFHSVFFVPFSVKTFSEGFSPQKMEKNGKVKHGKDALSVFHTN